MMAVARAVYINKEPSPGIALYVKAEASRVVHLTFDALPCFNGSNGVFQILCIQLGAKLNDLFADMVLPATASISTHTMFLLGFIEIDRLRGILRGKRACAGARLCSCLAPHPPWLGVASDPGCSAPGWGSETVRPSQPQDSLRLALS